MTDAVEVELTLRPCLVCGGPAVRFKTYAQRDTRPTLTGHVSTGEYDDYHTSCAARSGLKCRGAMLKTTAHTRAEADEKWNALHATQDTLRADNARLKRELEDAREGWRTDMENIPKGKDEPYFLGWCPSIFEGEEPELVMCYWSNVMGRIEAQGQTLAEMDVEPPIAFKVITPPAPCPTPPPSPTVNTNV